MTVQCLVRRKIYAQELSQKIFIRGLQKALKDTQRHTQRLSKPLPTIMVNKLDRTLFRSFSYRGGETQAEQNLQIEKEESDLDDISLNGESKPKQPVKKLSFFQLLSERYAEKDDEDKTDDSVDSVEEVEEEKEDDDDKEDIQVKPQTTSARDLFRSWSYRFSANEVEKMEIQIQNERREEEKIDEGVVEEEVEDSPPKLQESTAPIKVFGRKESLTGLTQDILLKRATTPKKFGRQKSLRFDVVTQDLFLESAMKKQQLEKPKSRLSGIFFREETSTMTASC